LDESIYPPRPHFLTLTPAPDLYSGHASPSFRFGELRRAFGPDAPSRGGSRPAAH
jgi:hypothetical protein